MAVVPLPSTKPWSNIHINWQQDHNRPAPNSPKEHHRHYHHRHHHHQSHHRFGQISVVPGHARNVPAPARAEPSPTIGLLPRSAAAAIATGTFLAVRSSHRCPRCDSPRSPSTCQARQVSLSTCCESPAKGLNEKQPSAEMMHSHHDFPGVDREISIIEGPIELLLRHGFVGGVVVRREIFVREGFASADPRSGIKHEHSFEEIDRW